MDEVERIVLNLSPISPPVRVQRLIDDSIKRREEIDWFDFVPSNYDIVYTVLSAMQRGRFCDWGCGLGVVAGMAEILGYQATGLELYEPLVQSAKQLLQDHGLSATIEQGDYFRREDIADLYFVYCWPGEVSRTEKRFVEIAPSGSRLLIYFGPNDIRWIQKA